jgi:signal transduction histidine kinase
MDEATRDDRAAARCAAAWSTELAAFASAGAHELRNVLNAGLTNLEVVRSRSARGAAADAIAPYADSASRAVEQVAVRTEALLALAREGQGPMDVSATIQVLVAYLGLPGSATAPRVRIEEGGAGRWTTTAPRTLVRALLARAVRTAGRLGGTVTCGVARGDGILVRVEAGDVPAGQEAAQPAGDDDALVRLAAEHGIGYSSTSSGFEFVLPRHIAT